MREYELEVLEQYDIEVISTRKTRGAYFCNTKEGLMLLGPAGISVGRMFCSVIWNPDTE